MGSIRLTVYMKHSLYCLLSILPLYSIFANNNLRHWNLTDGQQIHAELVEFDEATNQVYLRIKEVEDLYLKIEDFSPLDQAWLVEWTRMSGQLIAMDRFGNTHTGEAAALAFSRFEELYPQIEIDCCQWEQ